MVSPQKRNGNCEVMEVLTNPVVIISKHITVSNDHAVYLKTYIMLQVNYTNKSGKNNYNLKIKLKPT